MSFDERTLNGMSVFAAVVDGGSFASAAEALDMSPPGVSRAIARLEARLGIRLFDRTTRSIRLTDEGRRFYAQVLPLLSGLEEAAANAAQGATSVRGRLRVHMDPLFSRLVLAPRLGEFMAAYPQLEMELATRDQLGDIVADGFDVAVRFGEPPDSTLVARKLLDTRILTVAAPAYLHRYGHPARPQELGAGKHICIEFRDAATGRTFPWEFHRKREQLAVKTTGRLIVNDGGTMHAACVAGYGIAQVMDVAAGPLVASGQLVELFPDWPEERFPLYALYPSRHHPSAKVRAFLDFVIDITASAQPASRAIE